MPPLPGDEAVLEKDAAFPGKDKGKGKPVAVNEPFTEDANLPDNGTDTDPSLSPHFRLTPYSQSNHARLHLPLPNPHPPKPPSPLLAKSLANSPLQNLQSLDDALQIALDETRAPGPGPIGYAFHAIRSPSSFWDPTQGPPEGLGPDVIPKEQFRLFPHFARAMQDLLLRPPQGHLFGAATHASTISEITTQDGPHMLPLFWNVPMKGFAPLALAPKQKPRQKYGPRGGGRGGGPGRKQTRGGGTTSPYGRTPHASPPYLPRASSPLAGPPMSPPLMSPRRDSLYSPIMGRFFPAPVEQEDRGETRCVCPPPGCFLDDGWMVSCDVCGVWFHGGLFFNPAKVWRALMAGFFCLQGSMWGCRGARLTGRRVGCVRGV